MLLIYALGNVIPLIFLTFRRESAKNNGVYKSGSTTTDPDLCRKMLQTVGYFLILALFTAFTYGENIGSFNTTAHSAEWIADDEMRLVHDLFSKYNKIIRPVKKKQAAVPVSMELALTQIVDLDEKNQILITGAWLRLRWTNNFLVWNSSKYGGITSFNVEPKLIWFPDIQLYNSAVGDLSESFTTRVILKSNGQNVWYIPIILRSRCKIDIRYFPFDEQSCPLKFGSWTYHGLELDFKLAKKEADLAQYQTNGEFELISARAKRLVSKYSCCKEPYINIIFTIHFRRKKLFYLNNLIVPCILITLASLFTFILPPNTGERVTLVITTLLSLTVFMMMIAEETPTNSDVTPMIAQFFMASMIQIGLALVVTCLILNIHHSTRHSLALPRFIRVFALDVLAPLLCVSTPKSKQSSKRNKPGRSPREAKEERFLLTHNFKQVLHTERMNGHVHHDVMESPKDVIYRRDEPDETDHAESDFHPVVVQCSCRGGLSTSSEEKLVNGVSYLAERERQREKNNNILDEWEVVAKVADRSFLVLFLITITCTSLKIFTQSPSPS